MSISEQDRQVLEQLAANGDNAAIPRPVVHFFYAEEKEPLDELANRLEAVGWSELELAKSSEDYRLLATMHCDVLEGTVEAMMTEVEQAVGDLNVDYDGWETSVEQNN